MDISANGIDQDRTNLVYMTHESIFHLFGHVTFIPNNSHLWSKIDGKMCHKNSIYVIGSSDAVTKKINWSMYSVPLIDVKYCSLNNNDTKNYKNNI